MYKKVRLLELKAPNWKEWAFTDGRCISNKENGSLSIGAGACHPQSNKITTGNPGGTKFNETINRAELAEIAAALINEHTHIATDSASTLWQIRNSIIASSYPSAYNGIDIVRKFVEWLTLIECD